MHKGEIDFITLGCSKTLVDAERVMRQLEAAGWKCIPDAEEPRGEICVINTCGFIGDAKEESINMILQMAERKKKGKLKKLIVMISPGMSGLNRGMNTGSEIRSFWIKVCMIS